jgi:peroxiredoxin
MPLSLVPALHSQSSDQIAKTTLKVGDKAPDFNLLSDKWEPVKLSDFHGKKNIFLAVYVLAFTGG